MRRDFVPFVFVVDHLSSLFSNLKSLDDLCLSPKADDYEKELLLHQASVPVPLLPSAATETRFSVPWPAPVVADFPEHSILSRCGYSVVGANRPMKTGKGPLIVAF